MGRIIFEVGGESVDEASVNDSTHRAVLRALIGIYKPRIEAITCGIHKKEPVLTFQATTWEELHIIAPKLSACCQTAWNRCQRAMEGR